MKTRTLILYVPVVHAGYLKFIEENTSTGDIVYLIDSENLSLNFPELKKLIRDIRAVPIHLTLMTLKNAFPQLNVRALTFGSNFDIIIHQVIDSASFVIMHDDDITSVILKECRLEEYQQKIKVKQEFLRWDRNQSLLQKEVDVPIIRFDDIPKNVFQELKKQVNKSVDWWRQVGCVIYDDSGNILLATYNKHYPNDLGLNIFGDPRFNFKPGQHIEHCSAIHSEAWAIAQAAREGISLKGMSVLVSDFPCPVCAKSLAETGIKNLIFVQGYSVVDGKETLESKGVTIKKLIVE